MEQLRRRIGFGLLTFYGVGVMVGAGIYVLVGAVAATAGSWTPWAFLLAGLVAAPTALTYGELSARMPESAGEAAYARAATGRDWVGIALGFAIVAGGSVSAAAVLQGGVGYLTSLVSVDPRIATIGIGAALTLIAIAGVVESLSFAAFFTIVEVAGLAIIVAVAMAAPPVAVVAEAPPLSGLALGGVLAFFAFVGFEDMVNMAEETVDPARTLPRAILTALIITSSLYALVAFAALRAVPVEDLAGSRQPLALVYQTATGGDPRFLSAIAVFAALNGVMAQIIMASRVLFGLGRRHAFLRTFAHTATGLKTPEIATIFVAILVVAGALTLDLATLAGATSMLLLAIFCAMNAALIVLKGRGGAVPDFTVPVMVPWTGLILSGGAFTAALIVG